MTECYACAKLAELRAENSVLRGIVGDLKAPTDPGEASMMSVDAFVKKQTEHESRDSREKINALRAYYGAIPTTMTDEQIEAGREAYVAKKELDMVIIDELADTREKLEADARALQTRIWQAGANSDGISLSHIIELLDRQAAITEREWIDTECAKCGARENERDRDFTELQAKVDELTEQLETAHAKNRALKAHIAKMQEGRHGRHVKGVELQREVDRLTRENVSLARDLGECMAERDELIAELDALEYEGELDTLSTCNTCAERVDMQERLEKIRDIAS